MPQQVSDRPGELIGRDFDHIQCSLNAGADGIYLFNFFTSREAGEAAYEPPFEVLRDLVPANVGIRTRLGLERPDIEFKISQFPASRDRKARRDGRKFGT